MKGYRSHIVNGLVMVAAILALPEVTGVIPAQYVKFIPMVQGIVALVMRQITTTPVGQS
jgi:hypothetical protein